MGPQLGAGYGSGEPLAITLPAVPESARLAREFVVASLGRLGWLGEERLDQLALVTSELATNAIVHARTDLQIRVSSNDHEARVEVVDGAFARPAQARPWPWDTAGRGLVLVNALVDEWGVEDLESHRGGQRAKKVWVRVTGG